MVVLEPRTPLDGRYYSTYINERIKFAVESTGVPQLTAPQIAKYQLPIPPLSEQRAIAVALSDADALIGSLEMLIAKKRDLQQATMQQLLTGKTRLPGFAGKWSSRGFRTIFRKLNVKLNQIQTSDYRDTGLFPVIDQGQNEVAGFTDQANKLLTCPHGGLIIFGDHTRIVKFANFDFVVGADGTQVLLVSEDNLVKFFYYVLLRQEVPNTGYNRHFKFLKEMSFAVPEPDEQAAIAGILSDMDAELAVLEGKRDKARALKQGMMQEILTGRIRLA